MSQASVWAKVGGLAGGIVGELLSALLGDFIDATGDLMRTEVGVRFGFVRSWTAEAFDGMVEGEPHPTIGMSPTGLIDVLERFLRVTAQVGMCVGTEVADELFTEMIQEGYSNAIQTSLGGALQTMLNVWRGGMPPNPDELEVVVGKAVDMDEDTLALLIAMTGSNLPTTFFRVSRGFDQYVDEETRLIREQLADVLNRLNSVIAWLYEVSRHLATNELADALHVIKEAYAKGINLLDHVAERALSRLQELKIECETAKNWLAYSQAYPETPLITDLEATYVAIENGEEADATYNSYLSIKNAIETAMANIDVSLDAVVSKINDVVARYVSHLNKMIEAGAASFDEEISRIRAALEKVVAYRNAVENVTSMERTVEVIGEDTSLYAPSVYTVLIYVGY